MLVDANSMKVSVYRLMVDPEFYLFNYAENEQTSEFLIVSEELLEVAPFIDNRVEPHARGQFTVETRRLANYVHNLSEPRPRQHYIFHHAFVCSTLLARSLARSEAFFSLKEPQILRSLSDLKAGLAPGMPDVGSRWSHVLDTHLSLLAKNYTHGENTVVKVTNVANNLMPDILERSADSKLVYMYCRLEYFLVSNLKRPTASQQKIKPLLDRIAAYGGFHQRFPDYRDTSRFSFLQLCALLWLASNFNFIEAAGQKRGEQVRTLDMNAFLTRPRDTLAGACRFFGHEPTESELDAMTSDEVMKRHSKDPRRAYDARSRREESARILERFGEAIGEAAAWLRPAMETLQVNDKLSGHAL